MAVDARLGSEWKSTNESSVVSKKNGIEVFANRTNVVYVYDEQEGA